MASDSSIYGLIRQPAPQAGPLDMLTQQLQIKHLMDSGALSALQRQQLEQQLAEHQNVMQAFGGLQPGQDVESVLPAVLKASPTTGISLQKNLLEGKKTKAEIGKLDLETQAARTKDARDMLAGVTDQATYDAWKQQGAEKGYQVALNAPPQFDPNWQRQHLMTADQFLERLAPKLAMTSAGGTTVPTNPYTGQPAGAPIAHTATPGEVLTDQRARELMEREKYGPATEATIDGRPALVMQDKKTGQLVDASTKQPVAGATPKMPQPTPPTVGQVAMVDAAKSDMDNFEKMLFPKGKLDRSILFGINVPGTAGMPGNTDARKAFSALNNAIAAKLRLETGAQANDQEIEEIAKRFRPTLADTEVSAKDKVQRLKDFMSSTLAMTRPAPAAPSAPRQPTQAPVRIKGDDGFNALPSGALFIGPDGQTRRKP